MLFYVSNHARLHQRALTEEKKQHRHKDSNKTNKINSYMLKVNEEQLKHNEGSMQRDTRDASSSADNRGCLKRQPSR